MCGVNDQKMDRENMRVSVRDLRQDMTSYGESRAIED